MASKLRISGIGTRVHRGWAGYPLHGIHPGVPITARAVTIRRPMPSTAGVWWMWRIWRLQVEENPLLTGVTFSGGEPFCQPEPALRAGSAGQGPRKARHGVFRLYAGAAAGDGENQAGSARLLRLADTLVDGRYVEELRDLTLEFRGSSNQRIIDLHTVFDV